MPVTAAIFQDVISAMTTAATGTRMTTLRPGRSPRLRALAEVETRWRRGGDDSVDDQLRAGSATIEAMAATNRSRSDSAVYGARLTRTAPPVSRIPSARVSSHA